MSSSGGMKFNGVEYDQLRVSFAVPTSGWIPVTLWSKAGRTDDFIFNHLEEGHSQAEAPTPTHPNQSGWLAQRWEKKHAWRRAVDDRISIEHFVLVEKAPS